MPVVNNVTRFLDSREVSYEVHELPLEKLGADEAAEYLGVPVDEVYKTIVVGRDHVSTGGKGGKAILALVPGSATVDLKMLAAFLGEKKVHLPSEREAEHMTGLQAGGISPLALINRGFQVVIDVSAREYESIYISGGQRGLDIHIPVQDLARLTNAKFGKISRKA